MIVVVMIMPLIQPSPNPDEPEPAEPEPEPPEPAEEPEPAEPRRGRHVLRRRVTQPGFRTWRARPSASASGGTASVMTLPAAT